MHSRNEQIQMVKGISLRANERRSLNCPFCGDTKKKFSIARIDGRIVWNCYRASCDARGAFNTERNQSELKSRLSRSEIALPRKINSIPSILSSVYSHPDAVEYLKSVNSLGAYKDGLVHIKYSPSDNRVLFFNKDKTGAVGRALDKRNPKWWSYGDTSGGIVVGDNSHAVVVEDAASACSVSRIGVTGIALLGTQLTPLIKSKLTEFNRVTIILDKDASSKALSIAKKMAQYTTATAKLTRDDLKWMSVTEINKVVNPEQ